MNNTSLYALTVLIWGTTAYAITFQIGPVHPLLSVGYRFIVASFILFCFLTLIKKDGHLRFTLHQHALIALQGFFLFFLNQVLFYFAMDYLTSGLAAVIFSTMTLMNIVNQAIFFRIKVKRHVAFGSIIGIIGIALVFWPEIVKPEHANAVVTGIVICLLSAYTASLGNMASIQNNRCNIPVLKANMLGMAYGGGISILIAVIMGIEPRFDYAPGYIFSFLYLSIFTSAVAFCTYLTLIP